MPAKKQQKKQRRTKKKFIVTLSEREALLLTRYAHARRVTRPIAIKRLVSSALREFSKTPFTVVSENQLNLFDVDNQITLFDVISDSEREIEQVDSEKE